MATVAELYHYPIKGCASVAASRLEVGTAGPRHDRTFLLVEPDTGRFLSQREVARMAVIRPSVLDGGARLVLSAPRTDDAEIEVVPDGQRRRVSLFDKWFGEGVDQGDAVAKWCSAVLDRPVRLVRVPPDHDRQGTGAHTSGIGYHDSTALVIASRSSLDNLNARILEAGGDPVPVLRFRPNIVVAGWPEPHTEDEVRLARIGDVEIGFAKKDIRCVVTTVDQERGERAGPEPLRTLATYRREPELGGGVSFAMKAAVLRPGTMSVGDEVLVTEWNPAR